MQSFRMAALTALIAVGLFSGFSVALGYLLVRPRHHHVGPPPPSLGGRSVTIASASGATLSGWYSPGIEGKGAVLLLHGVHADRWQMLGRAQFLHRAGYGVLLIDFGAHGESTGDRITYGFRESADARSALAWLATRAPHERLAAIGVSMGAASTLLGPSPLPVQALVIEESYTDITRVTNADMRQNFGPFGGLIAPLLLAQLPFRLGTPVNSLRPIAHIGAVRVPIFIMCGAEDREVPLTESRRLFEAANAPKLFWAVPNAGHDNLYEKAPDEYERRVLDFFRQYLDRDMQPAKV